VERALNSKAVL